MPANDVTLDARLAARGDLRFTPAGVPALDFQLAHESVQTEGAAERHVTCDLAGVAIGPLARDLAAVELGAQVRCRGFLARRYRTGASVALHLNAFELMEGN
ncbi:MAG TPA: primosomal replication protein N [Casimicrobiaceae bacterium]|nr:primosomal replication protein N [Casimicrobiaceae bacterium]